MWEHEYMNIFFITAMLYLFIKEERYLRGFLLYRKVEQTVNIQVYKNIKEIDSIVNIMFVSEV